MKDDNPVGFNGIDEVDNCGDWDLVGPRHDVEEQKPKTMSEGSHRKLKYSCYGSDNWGCHLRHNLKAFCGSLRKISIANFLTDHHGACMWILFLIQGVMCSWGCDDEMIFPVTARLR